MLVYIGNAMSLIYVTSDMYSLYRIIYLFDMLKYDNATKQFVKNKYKINKEKQLWTDAW